MTKDGFVCIFESGTKDGEMTGAELVTKGAFVCGATGVTVLQYDIGVTLFFSFIYGYITDKITSLSYSLIHIALCRPPFMLPSHQS